MIRPALALLCVAGAALLSAGWQAPHWQLLTAGLIAGGAAVAAFLDMLDRYRGAAMSFADGAVSAPPVLHSDATDEEKAAATRAVLRRYEDERLTGAEALTVLQALGLVDTARGGRFDRYGVRITGTSPSARRRAARAAARAAGGAS